MERSNVSSWSQFQLPSSIKATRAPNILRSSLHYSLSLFLPTNFYLSFFFLSIPFPPPFSLLASNDRVIELKIIADLEKFCGRAQISTADKGQRPYRTVDLAALVSRCASFFLFFPPLNSTNCTNLLTFQRFQRVGPSR